MRQILKGSTNVSVDVYIIDSTDGTPETGVVWNTSGIDLEYRREGAAVTNITEATLAALTTAHSDGGFLTIGHGLYRLDVPDAAFATGVETVSIQGTVTGMIVLPQTIQLVDFDPEDGVRLGLTSLANAAADAAGGFPISDAGGLDLDNRMLAAGVVTNQNTLYDGVEGFGTAYSGPNGPGVYLNDAAANTNTANGVDGTWNNPVSTIAAAKTIADSLSVDRIYLINDTVITLAAAMTDYEFIGIGEMTANTINLGSQDVDNSNFENVLISGTQGGTGRFQAKNCVLSVIVSMEITASACVMAAGTLTLRNDCMFDSCWSAVAGTGTPILDINSVANVNVYFRHHSGGLQVNNAVATTVMSYEATGQIIIDATCTSLTIVPRGNCSITDSGTTTNITPDAAVTRTSINAEALDVLVTDTHAELAAVPAATSSLKDKINWLFALARNKGTQTSTTKTLRNDADSADIATAAVSSNGTTFTRNEYV